MPTGWVAGKAKSEALLAEWLINELRHARALFKKILVDVFHFFVALNC